MFLHKILQRLQFIKNSENKFNRRVFYAPNAKDEQCKVPTDIASQKRVIAMVNLQE